MEPNHETGEFEEVLEVEGGCQSVDYEEVEEVGERVVDSQLFGVEGDTVPERTQQVSVLEDVGHAQNGESQGHGVGLVSSPVNEEEVRVEETKCEQVDCHPLLLLLTHSLKSAEEFEKSEPEGGVDHHVHHSHCHSESI